MSLAGSASMLRAQVSGGVGVGAGGVWLTGSCVCRETSRTGRPRPVRAVLYLSIYPSIDRSIDRSMPLASMSSLKI